MRTITVKWPHPDEHLDVAAIELPVYLGWFEVPEEHTLANAAALVLGEPEPYPDPNFVKVRLER